MHTSLSLKDELGSCVAGGGEPLADKSRLESQTLGFNKGQKCLDYKHRGGCWLCPLPLGRGLRVAVI